MTQKSVFIDTSFLIASQVPTHEFFERTVVLNEKLVIESWPVFICPIVLDEFWYVLLGLFTMKKSEPMSVERRFENLRRATANIFATPNLEILDLSLDEKETGRVLSIMRKYALRPRDAMIVMLMKKSGIKHIASFDTDFDKVRGIHRLS